MNKKIIFSISLVVLVCSVLSAQLSIIGGALGLLSVATPSALVLLSAVLTIVIFALLIGFEVQKIAGLLQQNEKNNKTAQESGFFTNFLANHPMFACVFKLFLYSNAVALNIAIVAGLNISAVYSGIISPILILIITGVLLFEKLYSKNKVASGFFAAGSTVAILGVVFNYFGLVFLPVSIVSFFVSTCHTVSNSYGRVALMAENIRGETGPFIPPANTEAGQLPVDFGNDLGGPT